MNTETGEIYRNPTSEQKANPAVVPITEAEAKLLEKVPEEKRAECLSILRSINGYQPKESEENIEKALRDERARQDKLVGLSEDDPEELKAAVRNMGPLTRKRFMKRLNKGKMTDAKMAEYIAEFTKEKV